MGTAVVCTRLGCSLRKMGGLAVPCINCKEGICQQRCSVEQSHPQLFGMRVRQAVLDLPDHIVAKIKFAGSDECWEWQGEKSSNGYGRCWFKGVRQAAHRVTFAAAHKMIIEGYHIDHECCNRACVNPAHLQRKTPKQNMRLRDKRKRQRARQEKKNDR